MNSEQNQAALTIAPQLQEWAAELAWFDPELHAALAAILQPLQEMLGGVGGGGAWRLTDQAGIGDITRRGSFERLLHSEWAYADALPEEFMRRAANQELLFTGPQAERKQEAQLCLVLLDGGPSQAGEPRLVQMALLILMARRAARAGMQFQWGSLQKPGRLYQGLNANQLPLFLKARAPTPPSAAQWREWQQILPGLDSLSECWQVDAGISGSELTAALPRGARFGTVCIRRDWEDAARLQVQIRLGARMRAAGLPLPAPDQQVRLLRNPFYFGAPRKEAGEARLRQGIPAKGRPAQFSVDGQYLALPLLDGSVDLAHIPAKPGQPAGKVRKRADAQKNMLAMAIFRKNLVKLESAEENLRCIGWSSNHISEATHLKRGAELKLLPGLAHWYELFQLEKRTDADRDAGKPGEYLFVVDANKTLWSWLFYGRHQAPPEPKLLMRDVLAVRRTKESLFMARTTGSEIDCLRWVDYEAQPQSIFRCDEDASRVCLGGPDRGAVQLALQKKNTAEQAGGAQHWVYYEWRVRIVQRREYVVSAGRKVLGICQLRLAGMEKNETGLLVQSANRQQIIALMGAEEKILHSSAEPMLQVCFHPQRNICAWLEEKSRTWRVCNLQDEQPLLQLRYGGES